MKNFELDEINEENVEQNNSLYSEGKVLSLENENTQENILKKEYYLYGNDLSINGRPSNMGNTRINFFINNNPVISIGNNILIPLLLILFVCLIYLFIWNYFLNTASNVLIKMFNYSFLIYLISHTFSIFLNPGIPSFEYNKNIKIKLRENKVNELDVSRCKICNLTYKLMDKINHCYKCNICYYEQDHHCIWTGHCIGKYNRYFFGIFVFTIFVFILICFVMIFIKILKLFSN